MDTNNSVLKDLGRGTGKRVQVKGQWGVEKGHV